MNQAFSNYLNFYEVHLYLGSYTNKRNVNFRLCKTHAALPDIFRLEFINNSVTCKVSSDAPLKSLSLSSWTTVFIYGAGLT